MKSSSGSMNLLGNNKQCNIYLAGTPIPSLLSCNPSSVSSAHWDVMTSLPKIGIQILDQEKKLITVTQCDTQRIFSNLNDYQLEWAHRAPRLLLHFQHRAWPPLSSPLQNSMGDIQRRPFSKNYRWGYDFRTLKCWLTWEHPSGLINQSVIAIGITVLCISCQEYMKRKRRQRCYDDEDLGSRESWEFG